MEKELKNMVEEIVIRKYDQMKDNLNCCKCETCRLDVISCALNNLPSKYIVSTKGELFAKLDSLEIQFEASVVTALIKASELVGAKPRH